EHSYYKLGLPDDKEQNRSSRPENNRPEAIPLRPGSGTSTLLMKPASYLVPPPLGTAMASVPGHAVTVTGDELRFFAAQFTLPIEPGSDTLPRSEAYYSLQHKAQQARQVVEWNSVSLSQQAPLNQSRLSLENWVVVGVACPIHQDLHWLAYGYHDTTQRFEIY